MLGWPGLATVSENIIRAEGVLGNSQFPKCMVRRATAREKFGMKESLRQCIRPVCGVFVLLAMMRYAACLSYKTPRLCESHLRNQVSGTPF
jgi:hypothetical protein